MRVKGTVVYWGGVAGTISFRLKWPAGLLGSNLHEFGDVFKETPDVVVVHNPASLDLYKRLMYFKAKGQTKIVVGIDDDFTCLPQAFPAWSQMHPRSRIPMDWNCVGEIAKYADRVVVTTQALKERYGNHHPDCRIIPNYLPDFYYDFAATSTTLRNQDPEKNYVQRQWGVGWTGNLRQHVGDPDVMRGALRDFPLRIVGNPNDEIIPEYERAFGLNPGQTFKEIKGFLDHETGEYQRAMAEFAVGLVPLNDTKFNRAKSFLKGLEFAALGVPFVATDLPEYQNFDAGLRARKPKEWFHKVYQLLHDEELWQSEKLRGINTAQNYKLSDHIGEWRDAWYEF